MIGISTPIRWARVWTTLKEASWALVLPAIILGGIFGGVVTATEGAAMAVLAAILIGVVIYRELDWKHLYDAMIDGAVQTAVVMLLVAASALLGVHLTEIQAPQKLAAAAAGLSGNRWVVLALLNLLFLLLGFFLLMVVPYILTFMTKVWRWRVLFHPDEKRFSVGMLFSSLMISYVPLPFRMGEVARGALRLEGRVGALHKQLREAQDGVQGCP